MDIIANLTMCPRCNNVFRYYDYLSHSENCNHTINNDNENNNENNNYNENNEYDNDSMDTEMDEDDTLSIINSNYNYNGINDYANYMGYVNTITNTNTNTTNTNNTANNNYISNLSSYLSTITINSGLNQEQLNNSSKKQECNVRTECPICLCSFPEKTLFYKLKCSHLFCMGCCEKWFENNSKCPLCRNNYN